MRRKFKARCPCQIHLLRSRFGYPSVLSKVSPSNRVTLHKRISEETWRVLAFADFPHKKPFRRKRARRQEEDENERTRRACCTSKIRATQKRRGRAPYRACDAELAARVSKLAFSLSRLEVSDYFGIVGARHPIIHSASAFFSFPFPRKVESPRSAFL